MAISGLAVKVVVALTLCARCSQQLRISSDADRPTAVYRAIGTVGSGRQSLIITAKPRIGSSKPEWGDDTLRMDGGGVQYHDIECFQVSLNE